MSEPVDPSTSDERLRLLVEAVKDYAIFVLDADGHVASWNAGAQRIKQYSADDIIGRHFSIFYTPEAKDAGRPWALLEKARQEGRVEDQGWRVRKDGTRFFADALITALYDSDGQVVGFGKVTRDMTEQRYQQEVLRMAMLRAEEANAAKSEFLANMSHELRTPMNAILGLAEVLLESTLSNEQRESLVLLQQSAESLLGVLNEILDLSRIEAGRLQLEEVRFSLSQLLNRSLSLLARRAADKGLELTCQVQSSVPEYVCGDPLRLQQILTNLVSNAVKFTQHGSIEIRINRTEVSQDTVDLHIEVQDTGIGIIPDAQAAIFEPFIQADPSVSRRYGGTGLGLAISSRLATLMGGRLWVESEPGKGSTFHFMTPARLSAPVMPPVPAALAGHLALVAAPNLNNRLILQDLLAAWGMKSTIVGSGADALTALRWARESGTPYGVALLDANLTGLSGIELLAEIDKDPGLVTVPILMDTAGSHQTPRPDGVSTLIKPVMRLDLLGVLSTRFADDSRETRPGTLEEQAPIRPLSILLVEDNPVNQKVAAVLLSKRGHDVHVASSGAEAVALNRLHKFDIVLMDIQMPVMDGFATADAMRQDGPTPPMLAMTAHAMQGYRERCLAAGFVGYIPKPFKKQELFATVERHVLEDAPQEPSWPNSRLSFDRDALLVRMDGSVELIEELARLFLDALPDYLTGLREGLASNNPEAIHRAVHSLKGSAGDLCGYRVAHLSHEMEKAARIGDLVTVAALMPSLEEEVEALTAELRPLAHS